ncbi:Peptidase M3A/M3B [Penicillium freii]|nr:Peptidase M3A/M3B [Penicillium freii]
MLDSKSQIEISDLEREFQQNLARETGGLYFSLEELDRKKFVPFVNRGTLAVLTYTYSLETRKKIFLADNLKLKENKPLFKEIIKRCAR